MALVAHANYELAARGSQTSCALPGSEHAQVNLDKTIARVELQELLGSGEASSEEGVQLRSEVPQYSVATEPHSWVMASSAAWPAATEGTGMSPEECDTLLSALQPAAKMGGDAAVIESVEDQFDGRSATTEYLRLNKHIEQKMMATGSDNPGAVLEGPLRVVMMRCLSGWVQLMSFQSHTASWLDAIVRLDTYCARIGPRAAAEELPEVAMAILKLLKKEETGTMSFAGSNLSVHVNKLQEAFACMGVPRRRVMEEMLVAAEIDFLTALEWQVNLPTPHRYIGLFKTRLDTLTGGRLAPSLEWAKVKACDYALAVQLWKAASAELPILAVSIGLFAFFLLGARLLPVRALKPRLLDEDTWERLVAESEMAGPEVPQCLNSPAMVLQLLQKLELATDCKLTELQDACRVVVEAARDMLLEFKTARQFFPGAPGVCGAVQHHTL